MSKVLTPLDQFTPTVTVPVDGDPRNAASVELPFQALTDRSFHMRKGIPGIAASVIVNVPLLPRYVSSDWIDGIAAGWPGGAGGDYWLQVTGNTGTNAELIIPVPLPPVGKIQTITATVDGRSSHPSTSGAHAALPLTMPRVRLVADGGQIASATDSAASAGVYDAQHTIVLAALAHVIVPTSVYYIMIRGEGGTNSLASHFEISKLTIEIVP